MQRLAGEPDLSYLGACLWADALRSKRDPLAAVRRLYEALAPGAGALVEADAAAWDWARRAELTTEDRLLLLLEQAFGQAQAILGGAQAAYTVQDAAALGRLVVQLARVHEMILERRPPVRDTSADYSALSDADLETLRVILDRAKA